jgi:hypothetical protein
MANPVSAFLVKRPEQWPGLITTKQQLEGHVETVKRPDVFFRKNGPMPETLDLEISPPPAASRVALAEYLARVRSRLEELIFVAMEKLRCKKGRFLGKKRVLSQSPTSVPHSSEGGRKLKPQVSGKTVQRRMGALTRLRSFLESYREAWRRYQDGEHDIVFPAGTYWMKKHLGVPCASPG